MQMDYVKSVWVALFMHNIHCILRQQNPIRVKPSADRPSQIKDLIY
jgi:hypothetical protein